MGSTFLFWHENSNIYLFNSEKLINVTKQLLFLSHLNIHVLNILVILLSPNEIKTSTKIDTFSSL